MQMRLTRCLGILLVAATSSVLASSAMAQTNSQGSELVPVSPRTLGIDAAPSEFEPIPLRTIPDAFDRALFYESGNFYDNRSIPRQLDLLLGTGLPGRAAFPELEIERDAELVHLLYEEALYQQVASDPVLRTPDLPNPYRTSVLQLPDATRFQYQLDAVELFYETVPYK